MKVTLKEVAEKSGMSVTTVSRALNGFDDVAADTRAFIQATADQLGYTPNLNARRLKMQRAEALGFVLPGESLQFSDPFFSELFFGIIEKCSSYGLELNVTTPNSAENAEAIYLKYMRSRRVDGFILVRTELDDPRIKLLRAQNFPFVCFGRTAVNNNFAFVDEDGAHGIRQAVDHLFALGHRRIAYIGEPRNLFKSHQRALGYVNGLAAHNLPLDLSLMYEGNFRQRSGREGAQQLLALPNPPTAIVTANDLIAIGAINAVEEHGLEVGRDVSVTGFDNIRLAEYVSPSLTTLHQPAYDMGAQLCEHLVSVINGQTESPPQTVLKPTLIARNSTGPIG